ncbi:MAG: DUF1801 domain-containing protein [Ignavibacteriota bacterium]
MKDGFCHIATYTTHVNLGFNRGAMLPDPNRVLMGSGKLIRHITIHNESDLERPYLRRYLQAAIEQVGGRPVEGSPRPSSARPCPQLRFSCRPRFRGLLRLPISRRSRAW